MIWSWKQHQRCRISLAESGLNELAINLVGDLFYQSPFIPNVRVYIDATNPKARDLWRLCHVIHCENKNIANCPITSKDHLTLEMAYEVPISLVNLIGLNQPPRYARDLFLLQSLHPQRMMPQTPSLLSNHVSLRRGRHSRSFHVQVDVLVTNCSTTNFQNANNWSSTFDRAFGESQYVLPLLIRAPTTRKLPMSLLEYSLDNLVFAMIEADYTCELMWPHCYTIDLVITVLVTKEGGMGGPIATHDCNFSSNH